MERIRYAEFSPTAFRQFSDAILAIAIDVPNEYWSEENFLRDLPEKWALSFLTVLDEQPIGYAILSRPERSRIHLHHFMLKSPFRGQGIGRAMIERCIWTSRNHDAKRLTLKVAESARAARAFYRTAGFLEQESDGEYVFCSLSLT